MLKAVIWRKNLTKFGLLVELPFWLVLSSHLCPRRKSPILHSLKRSNLMHKQYISAHFIRTTQRKSRSKFVSNFLTTSTRAFSRTGLSCWIFISTRTSLISKHGKSTLTLPLIWFSESTDFLSDFGAATRSSTTWTLPQMSWSMFCTSLLTKNVRESRLNTNKRWRRLTKLKSHPCLTKRWCWRHT